MQQETSAALAAALESPFFASSPDGMVVVDSDGVIVACNSQLTDILGYEHEDIIGRPVEELVPSDVRRVHQSHRNTYTSDPRARPMGVGLRLAALDKAGNEVPVDIALAPFKVGEDAFTIASVRDATARLAAEAAVSEADEWRAIIDDRQRIARDLHDTVIQDIFAAGMGLQALQRQIPEDAARKQLGESITHLDSVITRLRTVIFNLTHGGPREPISGTIHRVIDDALNGAELAVDLTVAADEVVLAARIEEHVLATLQEALSNVVRHARATRVEVAFEADGQVCLLSVIDDGVGMADAAGRPGFGLTNMINRAQVLGGSCAITRSDSGGTKIEWKVPI